MSVSTATLESPLDAPGTGPAASTDLIKFLALFAGWSVLFFGVLRSQWFLTHAVVPFTDLQAAIAAWYGGGAPATVSVGIECSGTDMMALCAGVMLAYPTSWRRRVAGVALVLPVLLLLNVARISSLFMVSRSPDLFRALHLYVWPGILVVVAAGLIFVWMRAAGAAGPPLRKAATVSGYIFGAFVIATPLLDGSAFIDAVCVSVAGVAHVVMGLLGVATTQHGAMLATPRGAILVTPDCVLSPVIPMWLSAVLWPPLSRPRRFAGLLLTLPVVAVLAVARLLVLAVPPTLVASPFFVVHGFQQLVVFAAAIAGVAMWGTSPGRIGAGLQRALTVLTVTSVLGFGLGAAYNVTVLGLVTALSGWTPHALQSLTFAGDVQGALLLWPPYQLALFGGLLWARGQRVAVGSVALGAAGLFLSHVSGVVLLGEIQTHAGIEVPVVAVRAWAVLLPVVLAWLVWRVAPDTAGTEVREAEYLQFWQGVGDRFPDLGGAASTAVYREGERRLFRTHLPNLDGLTVLKTDSWDEARNTRILQWVQQQGATVIGIDISGPTLAMAKSEFGSAPFGAVGADVRELPFGTGTVDAVYSMGTIEHFAETEQAVREIFRVLKPGGTAIIGVPNRRDPFLRPLLVGALWRVGLYDYGFEKSYTHRQLGDTLTRTGFTVQAQDGLLFMPGWLRMADLVCHTRLGVLSRIVAPAVKFFGFVEAHVPFVRRHGYLIAAIGQRPVESPSELARAFICEGFEFLIDARGCDPDRLRSRRTFEALFNEIIRDSGLQAVGPSHWHAFGGEAGLTGIQMLSESHLACHTYPEASYVAFSLYSCGPNDVRWPWEERLAAVVGAEDVSVRVLRRGPKTGEWNECSIAATP